MEDRAVANTSYTNKDFQKIFPELLDIVKNLTNKWDPSISAESDPGVILLKLDAILGDKLNYAIDKNVLECFPLSVTQERNARQIYEQLGYQMKWYQSATTNVTMKWIGDISDDYVDIPLFTMVCDEDNNNTYTLLGPYDASYDSGYSITKQTLKFDPVDSIVFKAIQGTAIQYEINGQKVIKTTDLDAHNRLYFNTTDIAQNGIFVCNTGMDNYSEWQQKSNLLVENLNNTYFEFGVSQDLSTCYIEFPDDIESLVKDGLEVIYIKSAGKSGNIGTQVLEQFIGDLSLKTVTGKSIILSTENTKITNYTAATDGSDPETLDEAYKNFKRTIGVFDTLITLRDYINYIISHKLASNGFVCDRSNDPQSCYNVITLSDNVSQLVNTVDTDFVAVDTYVVDSETNTAVKDETQRYVAEKRLSAFDLKLYLFNYVSGVSNANDYNATFDLIKDYNITQAYLSDTKSINHNFKDILTPTADKSHICFFINKYPVSARLITKAQVTAAQASDIIKSVQAELYRKLNSQEIEFGDPVTVEMLSDIIVASDNRIKTVSVDAVDFQTYAVYFDGETFKSELISDKRRERVSVNINYSSAYTYKNYKNYTVGEYCIYKGSRYRCKYAIPSTGEVWNPNHWTKADIKINWQNEAEDSANGMPLDTAAYIISNTSGVGNYFTFIITRADGAWVAKCGEKTYQLSQLGITSITDTSISGTSSSACLDNIVIRISLYKQFRDEIYTKSVLAGKTQFFISDEEIDYKWSQAHLWTNFVSPKSDTGFLDSIEKIKTDSTITFNNTASTLKLKNNETLQIMKPSLLDIASYSSYVKFEYRVNNQVKANQEYQLRTNEYVILYWKEDGTESEDYKYICYGPGTIINPNFTMNVNGANLIGNPIINMFVQLNKKSTLTYDEYPSVMGELNESVAGLTKSQNVLTTGKTLKIREINQITIDKRYPCYWITNFRTDNGQYELTFDDNGERILDTGEYFIYTNAGMTDLIILGAGTKLKLSLINDDIRTWYAPIIESEDIFEKGSSAISSYSAIYTGREKAWGTIPEGVDMNIIEYEFLNINPGYEVMFTPKSVATNWSAVFNREGYTAVFDDVEKSLSDFTISYRINEKSPWVIIEDIDLVSIESWDARSLMSLNISPTQSQVVYANQKVYLYTDQEQLITITGQDLTSYDSDVAFTSGYVSRQYYPVCLHSTYSIDFDGAGTANVSHLDDFNDSVYNRIYIFSEMQSFTNAVARYTTDGSLLLTIEPGPAMAIGFNFKLPDGEYIIKIGNSLANAFSRTDNTPLTVSFNDELLKTITDNKSDIKRSKLSYMYLNISSITSNNDVLKITVPERTDTLVLSISNPFKYTKPEALSDYQFTQIKNLISKFDIENMFDFTNIVENQDEIRNPLDAISFMDKNHIFNSYTICKMDTDTLGSNIKIYGKK